jgi:hypothetical protein
LRRKNKEGPTSRPGEEELEEGGGGGGGRRRGRRRQKTALPSPKSERGED